MKREIVNILTIENPRVQPLSGASMPLTVRRVFHSGTIISTYIIHVKAWYNETSPLMPF